MPDKVLRMAQLISETSPDIYLLFTPAIPLNSAGPLDPGIDARLVVIPFAFQKIEPRSSMIIPSSFPFLEF